MMHYSIGKYLLVSSSVVYIVVLPMVALSVTTVHASTKDACFGGYDNAPYLDWVADKGTYYPSSICYNATGTSLLASSRDNDNNSTTTAGTNGIAIHWKLDEENVYVGIAVRATGWVGFGLAESGGMKGSDILLYETANPNQVRDTHVLDFKGTPIDDLCNDWVYVDSRIDDNGFIIFEAFRKLDTMDPQDHKIWNDTDTAIDPQRIIAAWGDETSTATFHGPSNTVRGTIRWYAGADAYTLAREKFLAQADGYFDLFAPNHTIAAVATDYVDFCFVWDPDLTSQGVLPNSAVTLFAAEMIVRDQARPFVHHATVFASNGASNTSRTCVTSDFEFTIYSWAPGSFPFVLPDNVGHTVGPTSEDGLQSFRLQIHYTNVDSIENITDDGGLRVYYTLQPREHELGILGMADMRTLLTIPVPKGYSQFDFECSPGCSSLALGNEPVTVFQEIFHMHASGTAAATYQIRAGSIVRESHVDYFDFYEAGAPVVRQSPFMVYPGDSFVSKFWYNSENGTEFGQSSYEEMSFAIYLYYPAKKIFGYPWVCTYDIPITTCNATVSNRELSTNADIERIFGPTPAICHDKATIETNGTNMTATSEGSRVLAGTAFISRVSIMVSIFFWLITS